MNELKIHKKSDNESIPWQLLLSADQSKKLVKDYLENGQIYLAFLDTVLVGVTGTPYNRVVAK